MGQIDPSRNRLIGFGMLAGMAAGVVMALYAMAASAWMGQGLFTPLYGIAAPVIGPSEMETSMMRGVYLALGPALGGAAIHMAWSAFYGAVFAALWSKVSSSGASPLLAGVVFGLAVMTFMSFVVLPLVGASSMPVMVGTSFALEHALFGLALGVWAIMQPSTPKEPLHVGASRAPSTHV